MEKVQIHNNNILGFIAGVFGGISSFVLNIQIGVLSDVLVAALTAGACGFAGIAGKEVYVFVKRKLFKKK